MESIGPSRKSNISIDQCAQGFSLINILKNRGIENGEIAADAAAVFDIVDTNRECNDNYKELSTFIQDIYKIVKKFKHPVGYYTFID